MKIGRPPKYEKAAELQKKIEEYFADCDKENGDKITITGLIFYCGFASRHAFYDYEKKDEFKHTIKRARLLVENHYEKILLDRSPVGAIFALKNLGWTDSQHIDHTTGGGPLGFQIDIIDADKGKAK